MNHKKFQNQMLALQERVDFAETLLKPFHKSRNGSAIKRWGREIAVWRKSRLGGV
jgi:hypothetical protein